MTQEELLKALSFYFPNKFSTDGGAPKLEATAMLVDRLAKIETVPLSRTHFNQLLHLNHEAGVSAAFFRYYFLEVPHTHPYPLDRVFADLPTPVLNQEAIGSLDQLRFGLHRFYIDSLLFFGDFRTGYRYLRGLSYSDIVKFFEQKRFDTTGMKSRGPILPFQAIPADDRYLIAELACKSYTPKKGSTETFLESELIKAYKSCGQSKISVKNLITLAEKANEADLQAQLSFGFSSEEFLEATIESDEQLRERIRAVAQRFKGAREKALVNTKIYLSVVDEMDVYVATSMRNRTDFRDMSNNCGKIFKNEKLSHLCLRYFDPTNSAAESHEDKGLIECLMVKCAKSLIYFAGEKDSFGKDVEAGMALSLGKPVIIYCPATEDGNKRRRFYRDIHPLSRLIDVSSGVAVGAMITNRLEDVTDLLNRMFTNSMEYDIEQAGDGYFRLLDRLTKSVIRLQTNSRMLRESFWNYYHGVH